MSLSLIRYILAKFSKVVPVSTRLNCRTYIASYIFALFSWDQNFWFNLIVADYGNHFPQFSSITRDRCVLLISHWAISQLEFPWNWVSRRLLYLHPPTLAKRYVSITNAIRSWLNCWIAPMFVPPPNLPADLGECWIPAESILDSEGLLCNGTVASSV